MLKRIFHKANILHVKNYLFNSNIMQKTVILLQNKYPYQWIFDFNLNYTQKIKKKNMP